LEASANTLEKYPQNAAKPPQIRNAKPAAKHHKLADGGGRLKYRISDGLFCMQILLKTGLTVVF
jgi:hypothetical protein